MNIQNNSEITGFNSSSSDKTAQLQITQSNDGSVVTQKHEFDLVIVATGYARDMHQNILANTRQLLKDPQAQRFPVGRDYRVQYDESKIAPGAGIYLQGCNETTHGVSSVHFNV